MTPAPGARSHAQLSVVNIQLSALSAQLLVWRVWQVLSQPFRRLLALNLFFGRSIYTLGKDCQRWLWNIFGWLSAPPRTRRLRQLSKGYFRVRRWHSIVVAVLLALGYRQLLQAYREWQDPNLRRQKQLRLTMKSAADYRTWKIAVDELTELQGRSKQGQALELKRQTRLYDRKLLEQRLHHLQNVRKTGNIQQVVYTLRQDLLRNLGNMTNSELHEHFLSTPEPIKLYIKEVKKQLQVLTNYSGPSMTLKDKWEFVRLTRHAFGRTALVLSGGGALGAFHLGVCKALFQKGLLPRVMAGSSVGSIVAAIIATRNDAMLHDLFKHMEHFDLSFFSNSTASQFVRHLLLKGTLQDIEVLQKRLQAFLGDLTFLEAFNLSGRVLNVAVSAADTNEPPRVLNYMTAPNVIVWSAVACSSAFPYLFKPQELLSKNERGVIVTFKPEADDNEAARRWRDGSLEEDLPMRTLSEMFNVNYFMVSQTNPHIVPALNMKRRVNRKLGNLLEAEWKHRCHQLQQIVPNGLARWLKVLSQPWEGDVTMVLPSAYSQIKKAVTNPTPEDLQIACLQGEQATWVKLSAIKSNCGIELCLDECLKQLEAEDKAARKAEAARRQQAGLRPSRAAEEGAAAIGPDSADAHKDNAPVSALEEDVGATLDSAFAEAAAQQPSRPNSPPQQQDQGEPSSVHRLARSSSHGQGSGESSGSNNARMNVPAWMHVPRAVRGGPTMARIPSWLHFQALGMESVPSEDNMAEAKAQTVPHLDVAASASRTWSSDDLRNMGAPLSGPSGMPLMKKKMSLEPVAEDVATASEAESGQVDSQLDDAPSLISAPSSSLSDVESAINMAQDCCDSSAIVYDTLAPLNSSANNQSFGHGLDFIAP